MLLLEHLKCLSLPHSIAASHLAVEGFGQHDLYSLFSLNIGEFGCTYICRLFSLFSVPLSVYVCALFMVKGEGGEGEDQGM